MESASYKPVTLEVPEHNMTESFSVEHAERILRMKNNGGWQLPEKSKYTFDSKNGIRIRTTKKEPEDTSK